MSSAFLKKFDFFCDFNTVRYMAAEIIDVEEYDKENFAPARVLKDPNKPFYRIVKSIDLGKKNCRPQAEHTKYDYNEEVGEFLLSLAEEHGHPICLTRCEFNLYDGQIDAWKGTDCDGRYYSKHFAECYNYFLDKRRSWLDKLVGTSKLDQKVWYCLAWTQLGAKVQPPKEITSKAELTSTLSIEDMNQIMTTVMAKATVKGRKEMQGFE